jgi:methionyl-tRNA synthetase
MSKSKGNVVDPIGLIEEFGPDAIRYFLLREINLGSDGNFSRDALIGRINADLANDLGNLLHRTVSMIEKYHAGIIHKSVVNENYDEASRAMILATVVAYKAAMDNMEINVAIKLVWQFISGGNKYIDDTAPWLLAKDPEHAERLQAVMYNLAEILRITAILIYPFMPHTSPKIFTQLGLAEPKEYLLSDVTWGKIPEGTKVKKGEPLFPRIEINEDGIAVAASTKKTVMVNAVSFQAKKEAVPGIVEIGVGDFAKLDLRVGTILTAERVPKTDKLMKLTVQIGNEERTIVSGIAEYYTEEALIGKNAIVIANLKPAKLRGIESRGMLLAASDGEGHLVLAEAPGIVSGSKVK